MKASIIVQSWSKEPRGLAAFKNYLRESSLRFYASDMLFRLGFCDSNEFEEALKRTFSVLETIDVPIQENIRSTFRGENYQIYRDWKLSALALHLLKINGSPKNEHVAKYQVNIHSTSQREI